MFKKLRERASVIKTYRQITPVLQAEIASLRNQLIDKDDEHNKELEYLGIQHRRKVELLEGDKAALERRLQELSFIGETISKLAGGSKK